MDIPFTTKEINRLFEVVDHLELVDTVLIMIYTGFRIGELLIIKTADVDLENRTIKGGLKTDAGKDRIVPISDKIIDLISKRVEKGYEYLITKEDGSFYKYDNYYRDNFAPLMEELNMTHKPHDCRHTFGTLMGNAGADKVALQKIIGHEATKRQPIYIHIKILSNYKKQLINYNFF